MWNKYLIILIILICSCNLQGDKKKYDWQIPVEINTKQEALDYVSDYQYEIKQGVFLPDEFYKNGYGDCEDFSLMLQYIFETQLDIDADCVNGYYMGSFHMWVKSNGIIYEPTAGMENNYPELYQEMNKYKYPDSVLMVEYYGGFIE